MVNVEDPWSDGNDEIFGRVDVIGDIATLYGHDPLNIDRYWTRIDTLSGCTMTHDRGKTVYTGRSRQLEQELHLPPAEALISWTVTPADCQDCYQGG